MLEIATAVMGLIQSILIMFKRKENWIFYIANIVMLTIFSFSVHLYGDVVENSIYLVFGIIGLVTWYSTKKETNITRCTTKEYVIYSLLLSGIGIGLYFWLINTNDPSPFLDAITTGMGFTATLMMAFKKIEAWIIWLIDDILMAYIYFTLPDKAIWLMLLNLIWIFLAIGTYISWSKELKLNK